MNFMDALTYPYNSKDFFSKALLAFGLIIIPLVNIFGMFVLLGYGVKVVYTVSQGDPDLPDFDLGNDFGRGITIFLAALVYFIPVVIIFGVLTALFQNADALLGLVMLLMFIAYLVIAALYLVGLTRFGLTGDSSALFQLTENLGYVQRNPAQIILFIVDMFILNLIVQVGTMIGMIFFVIPGLIVMIAGIFSQFYLYAKLGENMGLAGKMKRKVQEY